MNQVKRVVIWGASGHARVVREALGDNGPPVVAVFDRAKVEPPFSDVPLYTGADAFEQWAAADQSSGDCDLGFVIAIGGVRGSDRLDLHQRLTESGLSPISVVHERAFVATGASCGPGAQILALAALCEGASIGAQTILNTAATVDHECVIGDGVHIGPGAHVAGLVNVGDLAFIGIGAAVLPRVRIGTGAVIGAGAVIRDDVPDYATMVGNPARQIGHPT
ncbi:MAG TPA: NeuD/PglB/VioB family sugar acetyltransferase [Nocardioides sp.]|uniref:NeuD/PglB/VioB family sugar acetyltransferase n=1 Tax=Nocardioides sp. TaxID=35761 RepID=UPI002F41DDF4